MDAGTGLTGDTVATVSPPHFRCGGSGAGIKKRTVYRRIKKREAKASPFETGMITDGYGYRSYRRYRPWPSPAG